MGEQHVLLQLGGERQILQKTAVQRLQLIVRPRSAFVLHLANDGGRVERHVLMIAAHAQRAAGDQRHHAIEHLRGAAAIADQITEKRKLLRIVGARVFKTRVQRVQVGMQVGKQGVFHAVGEWLSLHDEGRS